MSEFSVDGTLQPAGGLSPLKRSLLALRELRAKLETLEQAKTEPVAIIGMGCRFPGEVDSPESFWGMLSRGENGISDLPEGRWNKEVFYDPDPEAPGKMYTSKAGYLDSVDQFDAPFWGLSPRETIYMDPQQRLLLDVSWEALENAGLAPEKMVGGQTGVFVGISSSDYVGIQLLAGDTSKVDTYMGTGNLLSVAAGRISYLLGLNGPALAIDTACSSSLVAIHLACQHLRLSKCDLALAGGVNLILSPIGTIYLSKSHALAPDGRCKTFDAQADGYVRGEGCGVVVLKRLSDALRDRDRILAVIRGTAINHDGRSSGLTVPNGQAQRAVIEAALADTGDLTADQVDYVEAHGTGTPLGDPIELRALAESVGKNRSGERPLFLGSVKTNIGHLEAAAGMASLIKTVLAMNHGRIPPHLHLKTLTPHFDWAQSGFIVPTQLTPWPEKESCRIAGISSFGFSGTNAHIIIESAPEIEIQLSEIERPQHIITLSAQNETALKELTKRYENFLSEKQFISLGDVAYTVNIGRSHFKQRATVIGASTDQILDRLEALAAGEEHPGVSTARVLSSGKPKIAFLFSGQGSQSAGMGRQLYETQPTFHKAIDQCDQLLSSSLKQPLLSVLYPDSGEDSLIHSTEYTQPALFALEYGLAKLWQSWGIAPAAVMGHSVGEYVAACLAGVFSLEDGLELIAERGRLMGSLPSNGGMAAVFADLATVQAAVRPHSGEVSIAAINGPQNIVISGLKSRLDSILQALGQEGIKSHQLTVSHAFHSPLMEPILSPFERAAQSIHFTAPGIRLVSNTTGKFIQGDELSQPAYWSNHISQPVRFSESIQTLKQAGCNIFIEVGPKPTLIGMAQQILTEKENIWLPSLSPRIDDWEQILESLSELYLQGVVIDWQGFDKDYARTRIELPTYPFQRQRYWYETSHPVGQSLGLMGLASKGSHPLLGQRHPSAGKEAQYDSQIGDHTPSYLADRQIYGRRFLPESFIAEISLAAGENYFQSDSPSLENLIVFNRLELLEEELYPLQTVLTPEGPGRAVVKIFTWEEKADEGWTLLAEGHLLEASSQPLTASLDVLEFPSEIGALETGIWLKISWLPA